MAPRLHGEWPHLKQLYVALLCHVYCNYAARDNLKYLLSQTLSTLATFLSLGDNKCSDLSVNPMQLQHLYMDCSLSISNRNNPASPSKHHKQEWFVTLPPFCRRVKQYPLTDFSRDVIRTRQSETSIGFANRLSVSSINVMAPLIQTFHSCLFCQIHCYLNSGLSLYFLFIIPIYVFLICSCLCSCLCSTIHHTIAYNIWRNEHCLKFHSQSIPTFQVVMRHCISYHLDFISNIPMDFCFSADIRGPWHLFIYVISTIFIMLLVWRESHRNCAPAFWSRPEIAYPCIAYTGVFMCVTAMWSFKNRYRIHFSLTHLWYQFPFRIFATKQHIDEVVPLPSTTKSRAQLVNLNAEQPNMEAVLSR